MHFGDKKDKAYLESEILESAKSFYNKNGKKFNCKEFARYLGKHPRTVQNHLNGNKDIYAYMLTPREARSEAHKKINLIPNNEKIKKEKQFRDKQKRTKVHEIKRQVNLYQIERLRARATCPATMQRLKELETAS
jgi:predicted transcriptional regulator